MESDTRLLGWKLQRRWQERLRNRDQRGRQTKMGDNQQDRSSFESGCGYGGGSYLGVRAHECPRSDPLEKSECTEHQSTNNRTLHC